MKKNVFAPTDFGLEDVQIQVSELLVATADESDEMLDRAIGDVLRLLRERMGMDVVFVSEFVEGSRVFRKVEQPEGSNLLREGEGEPLEQSWCQRVVDGRLPRFIADARKEPQAATLLKNLPFPIGTHISTPLVLSSGEIYGTLCCFSFEPNEQASLEDLARLQLTAKLTAQRMETRRQVRPLPSSVPDWSLKPK